MSKALKSGELGQMPSYWREAMQELVQRDRIMKRLIAAVGDSYPMKRGDPFKTLTRSIIGQQISVKAADMIWLRFKEACPVCSPVNVIRTGCEKFLKCGLSKRKTEYVMDLAGHFRKKTVHPEKWMDMNDEEVIADLTRIRGVGRWTAEMFLIFNLHRQNVLPLDDVGLIKGISTAYFSGEPVTRMEVRELASNWQPWCTVATWYLWRSLTAIPVEY
jgi:DNA-3-methyladenine glycosylase II